MPTDDDRPPLLDAATLDAAYRRVRRHAHRTPVLTSGYFDQLLGASVFFKCENFQKVGAFKFRGAVNAVFSLDQDELARGVVTHSSGNHAQALALAARIRGARATIVMPRSAPQVKIDAVRGYGARVILCAPTLAAREAECRAVIDAEGAVLIHPFDDRRIIAGQASAARELLEEAGPLDLIAVPVGGGGLASGTALTAFHLAPQTRVVGVEPRAADDAQRSLAAGSIQPANDPQTVADGLLTALSALTFGVLRRHLEAIVTVEDAVIVDTMRLLFERMKIVVEPSAAVPLAALVDGRFAVRGRRVGVILSGGNVDLGRLPWGGGAAPRDSQT